VGTWQWKEASFYYSGVLQLVARRGQATRLLLVFVDLHLDFMIFMCEKADSQKKVDPNRAVRFKAHLRLGYLSATSTYPEHYMRVRLNRC